MKFRDQSTRIHGISKSDVKYSPTLDDVRVDLRKLVRGSVLVSHSRFDKNAFESAMSALELVHFVPNRIHYLCDLTPDLISAPSAWMVEG